MREHGPYPRGWNWGAFWLNWVWGLGNDTPVALLTLVPGLNFIMPFILGAKGNEWAWRNGDWRDVEHFKRVQRIWAWVGGGLTLGSLVVFILFAWLMHAALVSNGAYQTAVSKIRYSPELEQSLGLPVEPFTWGGKFILNIADTTMQMFAVQGSKGNGVALVVGEQVQGVWGLDFLVIITQGGENIVLIIPDEGVSGKTAARGSGCSGSLRVCSLRFFL